MSGAFAYNGTFKAMVFAIALFAMGLAHAGPTFALANSEQVLAPEESSTPENPVTTADENPAARGTPVEAANHGGEHSSGGLPQLDFATYAPQLFWMAIIFLVLYLVMAHKALPEIGGIVEHRKGLIDSNLKAAEAARAEAETIRTAYEKNLETARAGAIKAVQDVEAAAKKNAGEQSDAFRKKADESIKTAEERVLAQRDQAMAQMKHVAAEVASVAAEKITGVGTDMQNAKAIVDTIADKAKAA